MEDVTLSCLVDYDIIFIGPLGAVVANLYKNRSPDLSRNSSKPSRNSSANINCSRLLIISSKKSIACPTLLPTHQPEIQVSIQGLKCMDQDTSEIYRILPNEQIIIMREKKYYHYRYLVYGQSEQEWMNSEMIENLPQALRTKYSYVYSNLIKSSPAFSQAQKILNKQKQWMKQVESKLQTMLKKRQSMQHQIQTHKKQNKKDGKHRRSSNILISQNFTEEIQNKIESATNLHREETINIIFYVPHSRHSGYDNYNILYKCREFVEFYKGVIKEKNIKQKEIRKYLSKIRQTEEVILKEQKVYLREIDQLDREREIDALNEQEHEHNRNRIKQQRNHSIFQELRQPNSSIRPELNLPTIQAYIQKREQTIDEEEQSPKEEEQQEQQQVICCKRLNFLVLLQGTSFFPYNESADSFFKKQLALNDIQVLTNQKVQKVDYLRRIITTTTKINKEQSAESWQQSEEIPDERDYEVCPPKLNFSKSYKKNKIKPLSLSYDYLFAILKQKTPKLLQLSEINPYNNSSKYLFNLQYKNIFVFGADLFPTTHSFDAINYQAHIICANLVHFVHAGKQGSFTLKKDTAKQQLNSSLVEYNGYTSFPIWIDNQNFIRFQQVYSQNEEASEWNFRRSNRIYKTTKNSSFCQNEGNENKTNPNNTKKLSQKWSCMQKCVDNVKRKWFIRKQIQMYYNLRSFGKPYYFFVPEFLEANTPHCFVKTHSI